MSIKRKKKIAVLFFMMIIMAMTSITAFATINSYSNSLPSVQGHVTLVGGLNAKKSRESSSCAFNEVKTLGNNNRYAVCWVDNMSGGNRVEASERTNCEIYRNTVVPYLVTHRWTGPVEFRAHASNWGLSSTSISGTVDLG